MRLIKDNNVYSGIKTNNVELDKFSTFCFTSHGTKLVDDLEGEKARDLDLIY